MFMGVGCKRKSILPHVVLHQPGAKVFRKRVIFVNFDKATSALTQLTSTYGPFIPPVRRGMPSQRVMKLCSKERAFRCALNPL